MARTPSASGNSSEIRLSTSTAFAFSSSSAGVNRPHLRGGFRHANLRGWVKDHRASLIWAALTLVRNWVARGTSSYEEMTNVPLPLRERLAAELPLSTLEVEREAHARDGTHKALFQTGVTELRWDEDDTLWTVRTDRGDEFRSRAVAMRARFSGLFRSQCSSFAKPHSEEYVPPHQSIAPSDLACAADVISAASFHAR